MGQRGEGDGHAEVKKKDYRTRFSGGLGSLEGNRLRNAEHRFVENGVSTDSLGKACP